MLFSPDCSSKELLSSSESEEKGGSLEMYIKCQKPKPTPSHKRVNIASFVVTWSEMNKNSTNLIYANQLKTQICRSIISMIQKQKHSITQKAEKTWWFGCTFCPKLHIGWAGWIFSKKQKTKKLHDTDPKITF